jgi:hypothetical protein
MAMVMSTVMVMEIPILEITITMMVEETRHALPVEELEWCL